MKKFLLYVLSFALICAFSLLLVACSEPEPELPQLPHECIYVESTISPTCTTDGYTLHQCTCGKNYKTDEIPASHTLQNLPDDDCLVTSADCIHLAVYHKSCENCDFISTETFSYGDLAEHTFGEHSTYGDYKICNVCEKLRGELPIINITTSNNESIETDEYVDTQISVTNCADEYLIDEVDAQVKVRGNATSRCPKKPYRIKFNKKQKMLGLNNDLKAKSWVLLAEYWDKSFTRNMLALSLADELLNNQGYYASDYKLVEVYINGEYNGIYGLAEQQQVNDGRIDINEPEDDYQGVDIGYFIEYDSYAQTEDYYFSVDYKNGLKTYSGEMCDITKFNPYYTIKNDIYSVAQEEFIANYFQNLYDVIYEAVHNENSDYVYKTLDANGNIVEDSTITRVEEAEARLIDVDSLVNIYILQEITMNIDYGWSSFFMSLDMSTDGNKKLTFEAPWDFDWSLTCHFEKVEQVYLCNLNPDFFTASLYVNPWLTIFCHEEWFWDNVKENYQAFRDTGVIERSCDEVLNTAVLYEINFDENFRLWPESLETIIYNSNEFIACDTQKESSALIVEWLKLRTAFLDEWWEYTV